jgi:hypothetical protein
MELSASITDRLPPPLTLPEALRETKIMFDASNLSGISYTFPRIMEVVWNLQSEHVDQRGTEHSNRHPLAILWTSKMLELTGAGSADQSSWDLAYAWYRREAGLWSVEP